MHPIFPNIRSFKKEHIQIGNHKIYIEQSGSKSGIPILILHEGPGTGSLPFHRRLFDPEHYRMIVMDQRGSGQSESSGDITDNTTSDLIQDIRFIKNHLQIPEWAVFGCGYGATLALLYAQKYPVDITALLLVGAQLCRQDDLHWLYQDGANKIYPDHWKEYIHQLKPQEYGDTIFSYHSLLNKSDDLNKMMLAKSWYNWHLHCMTLNPIHNSNEYTNPHHLLSMAIVQTHYLLNRFFIQENQILRDIDSIKAIPAYLIHGRYDMINRLESSHSLHQKWPASNLFVIRDAGHAAAEKAISDAIILSSNALIKLLK